MAIAFLTAGTATATDTNPADFHLQFNYTPSSFTHQFIPFSTDIQDTWMWDFGDSLPIGGGEDYPVFNTYGTNSTIANETHTYMTAGGHNVTLKVCNHGNWYSVTKTILVGMNEEQEPAQEPVYDSTK